MKVRRSERLIDITNYLKARPHELVPLTFFAKKYQSAKSSISEDITIVKHAFLRNNIGLIQTLPGAGGGVLYTPGINQATANNYLLDLQQQLADPQRILPGGYLYLSDMLGNSAVLKKIGRLIATQYAKDNIDVVMTMATKGIPIAQSVASYLNVPFVIVRRESKITEGPTLSVHYASESAHHVEKMELSKRSLLVNSHVLAVDDFMKGGGTIKGMTNLIQEFESDLVGATVLVEAKDDGNPTFDHGATALFNVSGLEEAQPELQVNLGNYLEQVDFSLFETTNY
ncbi:pur operon repressor [Bombilactobacillus thymidiniphilus]|uniref:Pur operon repressor n=1 Tax=Bombilactobacillus thymidiniphilus TaxID=2923363 RepID=A0ABY4PE43_9LACO|nr:pur operon repressor [Bombilactobacillus thymidiniphilus]UQS84048.1 pur operon repressor [Bombilactobacillus thymidiniphilus]